MDFQPAIKENIELFRGPSYRGFDIFCFVSYGNQPIQNNSTLVEPDFELHGRPAPEWAIIPLHHQLAVDRARNEEL